MVCALEIVPKFSHVLTQPDWKQVDLNGRLDLVEAVARARYPGRPELAQPVWDEMRPRLSEALKQGRLSVQIAELDLLDVGRDVAVYRIDDGACPIENRGSLTDRALWNEGFINSQTEVLLGPQAYEALRNDYDFVDPGDVGEVLLYAGRAYRYFFFSAQQINSSAPPTNVILVSEPTHPVLRPGGKSSVSQKDYCRIVYQAPEATE